MNGYLLVKKNKTIFLGDGLEKIEGMPTDFLKNVGKYFKPNETLEIFGELTYAEVKYIRIKNPGLKIKVTVKHDPVDFQRQIKDAEEISKIKKSMQIVEGVFKQVRKEIKKPKITEVRLAEFIKNTGLKMGAEEVSFPPIVASGMNAAVPHHVPSKKRLKIGESIILDFGFKYKNYCSDFTRTVFLNTVPKSISLAYNQVEKSYNESINFVSAGVKAADVYQRSVDVLAEKHLAKYFIHSLGHGSGLEIHELPNLSPNSKDLLKNGMVFSIEPGVYMPRFGGIRIEDLVYLKGGKVYKFINVLTKLTNNIL
jgi:Xaa-Pro aminopeptidase